VTNSSEPTLSVLEPGPAFDYADAAAVGRSRLAARHPVLWFTVRRVAAGVVTLFIVSILIFIGTSLLPGNAARAILGQRATPQSVAALEQQLGLNKPATEQYWTWLSGFVQGDLGKSASSIVNGDAANASVASQIAQPLRNSAALALITMLVLAPVGLALGVWLATRAGGRVDQGVSAGLLGVVSLPEFVIGSILAIVLSGWLGLLPAVSFTVGGGSPVTQPKLLVLPVLTLLAASLAYTVRFVRTSVIESLKTDYVAAARLGGVSDRRILWRYAVRNSLPPTVQVLAQTAQWLVGGIVVTEALFAYPGIGKQLVDAVSSRDAPTVQSIALILAAFYITLNIVADLLVVYLVPKLRTNPDKW
jgi:peptide/nickel transport system permease protein